MHRERRHDRLEGPSVGFNGKSFINDSNLHHCHRPSTVSSVWAFAGTFHQREVRANGLNVVASEATRLSINALDAMAGSKPYAAPADGPGAFGFYSATITRAPPPPGMGGERTDSLKECDIKGSR
jgi:hypothetical protein